MSETNKPSHVPPVIEAGRSYRLRLRSIEFDGAWLEASPEPVFVNWMFAPSGIKVGDEVSVFVYHDTQDRLTATVRSPKARLDDYAALVVADVNQVGAFLDWGLEKDLFCPFGEQTRPLRPGDRVLIRVCRDTRNGRLFGSMRLDKHLMKPSVAETESELPKKGGAVRAMLWSRRETGWEAVVDNRWVGLFADYELRDRNPNFGDTVEAWVKAVRPHALDLAARPLGQIAREIGADRVLAAVKREGGFLALHDGSHPDEIQEKLGMSKKVFKKAVGTLLREKCVRLEEAGIRLLRDADGKLVAEPGKEVVKPLPPAPRAPAKKFAKRPPGQGGPGGPYRSEPKYLDSAGKEIPKLEGPKKRIFRPFVFEP